MADTLTYALLLLSPFLGGIAAGLLIESVCRFRARMGTDRNKWKGTH